MASSVPAPLPPFEPVPLRAFLKAGLPPTPRHTLTSVMQQNLKDYEDMIRTRKLEGTIKPHSLAVCELDRAFGKTYNPSMTLDMSPCLKTQLRYLFVISTDDVDSPDDQREFCRFIMPFERPGLQGVSPKVALFMRAGDILHSTGNAYPVPLIGACAAPVLRAIGAKLGKLNTWPKNAPFVQGDLPDVASFFLKRLPTKKIKKDKDKKGHPMKTKNTVTKKTKKANTKATIETKKTKNATMKKPASSLNVMKKPARSQKVAKKRIVSQQLTLNFGLRLTKMDSSRGGGMASSESG